MWPNRRTAASLAGSCSGLAAESARTPVVPKPHPAREETLPLKAVRIPISPIPWAPISTATTFARTKLVAKVTTEAPPMTTLERRIRAKDIAAQGLVATTLTWTTDREIRPQRRQRTWKPEAPNRLLKACAFGGKR